LALRPAQTSWPNADFLILLPVRFLTKPMKRSSMFLSLVFSHGKVWTMILHKLGMASLALSPDAARFSAGGVLLKRGS
jgi:hypothetical protein